jgi:hypothetical protein
VLFRDGGGANLPTEMVDPLTEEKLAQIRAWAEAMLTAESVELRAAARGLLLLADEIERLREASRHAFADDIAAALVDRLGTEPMTAASEGAPVDPPVGIAASWRRSRADRPKND